MKKSLYKCFVYLVTRSLVLIDIIFKKFFKQYEFLPNVHDRIELKQYHHKIINNETISFFVPSTTTKWRVDTYFSKEPETLNWINNFKIKNSKKIVFWDIGANIGLYSIYAALKFKDIEIISFEPSTSNTRTLSRNISINNLYDKIKIFPLALSDKENIISFFKETTFTEGGSVFNFDSNTDHDGNIITDNKIQNQYKIFGTTIDFLINSKIVNVPNYMKIDVDGIEHLILNGAKDLLKNNDLEEVCIEVNRNYSKQYELIYDVMSQSGFKSNEGGNLEILNKNSNINEQNEIKNIFFTRI